MTFLGWRSLRRRLPNFLDELTANAKGLIRDGYYSPIHSVGRVQISLKERIQNFNRTPIIAEIKPTSPSTGPLMRGRDPLSLANDMVSGGAVGLSILTEPNYFNGSVDDFVRIRKAIDVPLLMKDVIVDRVQIDAAQVAGADAVLLIAEAFQDEILLQQLIAHAHRRGLEVLLEVNSANAFRMAAGTDADILGVNNRDLKTLDLNIHTSRQIAATFDLSDYTVICESGISSRDEILELRRLGYSGFLIGTSILNSNNITGFLMELSQR